MEPGRAQEGPTAPGSVRGEAPLQDNPLVILWRCRITARMRDNLKLGSLPSLQELVVGALPRARSLPRVRRPPSSCRLAARRPRFLPARPRARSGSRLPANRFPGGSRRSRLAAAAPRQEPGSHRGGLAGPISAAARRAGLGSARRVSRGGLNSSSSPLPNKREHLLAARGDWRVAFCGVASRNGVHRVRGGRGHR